MKWLDNFIVSKRGQWEHPGKLTAVRTDNGIITMDGVPYPVFAMDETGYGGMIYPGGNYQFRGKMVYEIPMAQYGNQIKKSIVSAEELPEDAFPYEGTSAMFKDERYNIDRAKKLYTEDEFGHLPSIDYETGEWLKAKRYPTSWKEFLQYTLNPEVNKLGFPTENKEGFLKYPNYGNGGDISIPDLSRPNWLDKAQEGQQVKYYDDLKKFKRANQLYNDSLIVHNAFDGNIQDLKNADTFDEWQINFARIPRNYPQTHEALRNLYALTNYNYAPSNTYVKHFSNNTLGHATEYKKPTQKPVYKEKPKEYIPTKTPRLEREPLQLVMPQSNRILDDYNNTRQVLRGVQEEDKSNQNLYPTRVVPAPEFQKGGVHQKIYTDPLQFAPANKAYTDSLGLATRFPLPPKGYEIFPYVHTETADYLVGKDSEGNDIVETRVNKRPPIEPIGYTTHLSNKSGKQFNKTTGAYEEFYGTQRPIYKTPTQKPVYIVETKMDPYMPPSNTAEVLSQIKQEDLRKQGPKNVPAPDFRHGGWLDVYQGDTQSSQVAANLPGYNPEVGPTIKNAELLKQLEMQKAVRNSQSLNLPSGRIDATLGPVEYAVLPTLAAPAIKAAMASKAPADPELEAIRKILRKNVTHIKQTRPLTETPPWPNRFLELGDDAWVIGNAERGRTSVENPDILLPGNLPKRTPKQLPGVNGTQYPNRLPKQKNGGWLDNNQDYNYIKYKDLSLSRGTGWLDNYK